MKKLISIFGALTITATTTIMVVSCANLDNYYEIKNALDKDESMIILISAEDCEHCKNFTVEVEKYNNSPSKEYGSFDDMFTSITKDLYRDRADLSAGNISDTEKKLSGFGEVIDKVTFKEYKAETFENLFNEDWLISLKDLIRDQLREIYIENDDNQTKPTTDQINSKINTNYLDGIMTGTPTFLHFRHGRFIGTTPWDFKSVNINDGEFTTNIETYIKDLLFSQNGENIGIWGDANLSDTMYFKISESKPATEE